MRLPGRENLLLSMLGIALSAPARAYLRRVNLGLKHFLARFPHEFHVEGPKGCETVNWHGDGSRVMADALPPFTAMGPEALWPSAATNTVPVPGQPPLREPSTPKVPGSPSRNAAPASAHCVATPSDWGTPGHVQGLPGLMMDLHQPGGPPPPGGVDYASLTAAGWNPYSWPGNPWAGPPWMGAWPSADPAISSTGTVSSASNPPQAAAPKAAPPRRASVPSTGPSRPDGAAAAPSARSHAHLHPQSHPYAHRPSVAANSTAPTAGAGDTVGEKRTQTAALRLRGLPFSVSVQDVLAFFAQHDVADRIADGPQACELLAKANGRPSGQAVVQMKSPLDAQVAGQALHNQVVGNRYIEVFVYGADGEAPPGEGPVAGGGDAAGGCGAPPAPNPPSTSAAAGPGASAWQGWSNTFGDPLSWMPPQALPPPWAGQIPPPVPGTGIAGGPAGGLGLPGSLPGQQGQVDSPWAALFEGFPPFETPGTAAATAAVAATAQLGLPPLGPAIATETGPRATCQV